MGVKGKDKEIFSFSRRIEQRLIVKKRLLILLMIFTVFLQTNCFGRFAIISKLHQFVDNINLSESPPLLIKFVKSVVMWAGLIFYVAGLGFLVDLIVFNVIEFWTGDNLIDGKKEEDKGIEPGKSVQFRSGISDDVTTLSRSEDGSTLTIHIVHDKKSKEVIAFKNEPGNLYLKRDGQLHLITSSFSETKIQSIYIGSEIIPVLR
jgi:hypothetical protein